MKEVLSYIEARQKTHERHKFFTELLDNTRLSGEERLAFAPCIVPFIMGYADLNKYVFRNESKEKRKDPVHAILNTHTYEEDFHWLWMLDDIARLNFNQKMSFSDAARVFWSPDMQMSRRLCLQLAALAAPAEPWGTLAVVETCESFSITLFKHCQGIKLSNGDECEFFGSKHYIAETQHSIRDDSQTDQVSFQLTPAQREEAKRLVDIAFNMFTDWFTSLYEYGTKYSSNQDRAYHQMIDHSVNLPRRPSVPMAD
ncbi:MAG TPA: hypothetical protein VHN14_26620 [Kofleriaceae bacterium]|jgi:hypothetical protein|nr:hypothetical protein [Kofleriaceae bacterium]